MSSDQGLPHVFVNCFYQDHEGLLWIGTHNGVALCTGNGLKTPFAGNATLLRNKPITSIFEYPVGHYWIGTSKGLFCYNTQEKSFREIELPNPGCRVNDINMYNGKVVVLCQGGSYCVDTEMFSVSSVLEDLVGARSPVQLIKADKDILLVSQRGVDILSSNNGNTRVVNDLNGIRKGYVDLDSVFWAITSHGLYKTINGEIHLILDDTDISSITQQQNGEFVVGTFERGCFRLLNEGGNYRLEKLFLKGEDSGYFEKHINALFKDASGALWIGTNGSGVIKLNSTALDMVNIRHPKSHMIPEYGYINAIGQMRDGTVLAGSSGQGVSVVDFDAQRLRSIPVMRNGDILDSLYVECFYFDSRGAMWMGTRFSGVYLCVVDRKLKNIKVIDHWGDEEFAELGNSQFHNFCPISKKYVVAINGRGAFLFDVFRRQMTDNGKKANCYARRVNDDLSVLPNMAVLKKRGENIEAFSVYEDSKGIVWMGSNEGLSYYNCDSCKMISVKNGDVADVINSIEEDNNGYLWMGSRNGILRYDPNLSLWYRYKFSDNEDVNSFNPGKILKTRNGSIILGCNDGVIAINPGMSEKIPPPKVSIKHVEDKINSFDIANYSYNFSERNKLAYKLDSDKEWTIVDKCDFRVSYNNLPSGKHVLQVKGINADGVWSEKIATLDFTVESANGYWYFYVLLIVILIFVVKLSVDKYTSRSKDNDFIDEKVEKDLPWQENSFMNQTIQIIESKLDDPDFSLQQLYDLMQMSKSNFYRKLKQSADMTPNELIRTIRLRRAAQLLEQNQLSVNEIAFEVGFNSPSYFSKSFKKEYGCSPSEYKV